MNFKLQEVNSGRDWRRFINLPRSHYEDDPHFVPHLAWERRQFFSDNNPIFQFTDARFFLALDPSGRPLGRISAHVNHHHNEFHDARDGFFGFFESFPNRSVAEALLGRAEEVLSGFGMQRVLGPFNFSTNEECGMLVRGFDTTPAIMMPHTKRYYPSLLRECGYNKAKDLLAYRYDTPEQVPERVSRLAKRAARRMDVTIRQIDTDDLEREIERAFKVYASAWSENWGFVPLSAEEFEFTAESLRPIIDPALALVAEDNGRPVGFTLAVPDYNLLFKRLRGRLLPWGPFYMLFGKPLIHRARVMLLGVLEEYRRRGLGLLLMERLLRSGMARGYTEGEFSWVLEDNEDMKTLLTHLGARRYKTYRIYGKEL
jgi:GNAT superfamily N-acetyltransferase